MPCVLLISPPLPLSDRWSTFPMRNPTLISQAQEVPASYKEGARGSQGVFLDPGKPG